MKYTITIETDSLEEREAVIKAMENWVKLECIYTEVFRPVIKYGENKKEVKAFEMVWEKLKDYLNE